MIKINDVTFLKSAFKPEAFPSLAYPEFGFMGRSNSGKSSLINMITGRTDLVRVGSKPGVTRSINFFLLNGKISIADLPGYGYARVPKKIRETFPSLIREYINQRDRLRIMFLLIDIRRVPDEREKELINLLNRNQIPIAVTATKCDKLSKNRIKSATKEIIDALDISMDSVFLTSSKTNEGRKDILRLMESYL